MISEIVNVLAQIAGAIKNGNPLDEVAVSIKKQKVNENIIATAFSWVYEKRQREKTEVKDTSGIRFLANEELDAIGVKNYSHLMSLFNIGLLNNRDMEIIIDQIKDFPDGIINEDQINVLILSLYLNIDSLTPPGSRKLLYSSDSIN